jgi:hypothetical protein
MSKFYIEIGDVFDSEGYGRVQVKDIFISPTTKERCYRVETVCTQPKDIQTSYLVNGNELT